MPDAPATIETQQVAQDVNSVLHTVNTLRDGSMIFLLVLAVLALIAFRMWNKQKLAVESKKEKRADAYTGALNGMKASLDEQSLLLRQLVQNSQGSMNADDSLRLVEDRFDNVIRKEFVRIAVASIERNHFDTAPDTVELVATEAFARVLHMVKKDLLQYTMAINADAFFLVNDKTFALATRSWAALRTVHVAKLKALSVLHPESVMPDALDAIVKGHTDQARALLEREVNQAFNLGRERALDIYYKDPGSYSGRRHPSNSEIPAPG